MGQDKKDKKKKKKKLQQVSQRFLSSALEYSLMYWSLGDIIGRYK